MCISAYESGDSHGTWCAAADISDLQRKMDAFRISSRERTMLANEIHRIACAFNSLFTRDPASYLSTFVGDENQSETRLDDQSLKALLTDFLRVSFYGPWEGASLTVSGHAPAPENGRQNPFNPYEGNTRYLQMTSAKWADIQRRLIKLVFHQGVFDEKILRIALSYIAQELNQQFGKFAPALGFRAEMNPEPTTIWFSEQLTSGIAHRDLSPFPLHIRIERTPLLERFNSSLYRLVMSELLHHANLAALRNKTVAGDILFTITESTDYADTSSFVQSPLIQANLSHMQKQGVFRARVVPGEPNVKLADTDYFTTELRSGKGGHYLRLAYQFHGPGSQDLDAAPVAHEGSPAEEYQALRAERLRDTFVERVGLILIQIEQALKSYGYNLLYCVDPKLVAQEPAVES